LCGSTQRYQKSPFSQQVGMRDGLKCSALRLQAGHCNFGRSTPIAQLQTYTLSTPPLLSTLQRTMAVLAPSYDFKGIVNNSSDRARQPSEASCTHRRLCRCCYTVPEAKQATKYGAAVLISQVM